MTRPRPARLVRPGRARDGIPEATVSRLPFYLQALTALAERGVATVSSEELASAAGVAPRSSAKTFPTSVRTEPGGWAMRSST